MTAISTPQLRTPGPWEIQEQNHRILVRLPHFMGPAHQGLTVADCGLADSKAAQGNARLIAAAPDLAAALDNLALCFGSGPESEEWWEGWVDCTACDCTDPSHPHSEEEIRDLMLAQARVALVRAGGRDA